MIGRRNKINYMRQKKKEEDGKEEINENGK